MDTLDICYGFDCPFKDCENHVSQLERVHKEAFFSPKYRVCRKYIAWVIETLEGEKRDDNSSLP